MRSIALTDFFFEAFPFVGHLSRGDGDTKTPPLRADFGAIKLVTSGNRLVVNGPEVARDGCQRIVAVAKSLQLRVVPIALCFALQDFLGKERLTPERHQATAIEERRVKGP